MADESQAQLVPQLLSGVRTKVDTVRGMTVLLAPERAVKLDQIGAAILAEVDGTRSLGTIADRLAEAFSAPRDQILRDAGAFLTSLADRRMLDLR